MEIPSHRLKGIPLKVALLQKGITQREASRLLHMRYSTFNMKLLGERHFTDQEKEALAAAVDKTIDELFPSHTNTECEQNTQAQLAVNDG